MCAAHLYAIIGPQGVALGVENNDFICKWYDVTKAQPHLTVLIDMEHMSKDLGPMMRSVEEADWMRTQNPFIQCTKSGLLLKILFETSAIGIPQQLSEKDWKWLNWKQWKTN